MADKDFSESQTSNSVKKCRGCGEVVPKLALAFSNAVAIENGYCCWICAVSHLGTEKAYALLEARSKKNREKRQGKL